MCEARLRPICLHPILRVWLLVIQSLPSHKDNLGYLNKYHLFIAQTLERKFQKKSGKGTKPCIFHITIQKDTLCTRTAWIWQLNWHLFSLGAAGEPERTVKSLALTKEQGYEPLLPVSCRCITALLGSLGHWICGMGSTKQHSTQDLCTKQKGTPEPGAGLAVLCPSCHRYALAAFRDKLPAEQIIATALKTTTPTLCCNRTSNLKELPVNTGATNENNNFLI